MRTGPAQTNRHVKTTCTTPDYAAFAVRVIRAHARRVADGDVDALADLVRLADEVDAATHTAVAGLRSFGYSWGDIAHRLSTTRQNAQQRWGSR